MTDVGDRKPVEDVVWSDEAYQETYRQAGLYVVTTRRPLAEEDEPYEWVNKTRIAPWVICVLQRAERRCRGKRSKSFLDGCACQYMNQRRCTSWHEVGEPWWSSYHVPELHCSQGWPI